MSFLDSIPFLGPEELKAKLESRGCDGRILRFLEEHGRAPGEKEVKQRSQTIKSWESWCHQQRKRVKVVEADVPEGILPKGLKGSLADIKVGGDKRAPDDKLYNSHADLREKVARGNTILYLKDHDSQEGDGVTYDNMIFALKKFTGGMGDEDEEQPGDNKTWMDYFLKPLSSSSRVVCTQKANGEAAHLSARRMRDRFVLCAGSKNVHLLARCEEDLSKYKDSRYLVARTVAGSALDLVRGMDTDCASLFLSFLCLTRCTCVFEVLQPHYQHVVDLSHLKDSQLNFICWTLPFDVATSPESHCAVAPDAALDFMASLGVICVPYEIVEPEKTEDRMELIRRGYGYEGEVMYFIDSRDNVIGLLKKKTAWYVVCRAIREKATHALADYKKHPTGYSQSDRCKKLCSRLKQIQTWLGFSDEALKSWEELGTGFLKWLVEQTEAKNLPADQSVRGNFPAMWLSYLADGEKSDKISWE